MEQISFRSFSQTWSRNPKLLYLLTELQPYGLCPMTKASRTEPCSATKKVPYLHSLYLHMRDYITGNYEHNNSHELPQTAQWSGAHAMNHMLIRCTQQN